VITGRSGGWAAAKVRRGLMWCNVEQCSRVQGRRVIGGAVSWATWRRPVDGRLEAPGGVASRQYQLTWAPTPRATALVQHQPRRVVPCPCSYSSYYFYPSCPPLFMPTYGTAAARPGPTPFAARHPHVPRASPTGCSACSACVACIYAPSLNRDSAPIAPRAACDLPSAHMWLGAIRPLGSARSCKSLHARCANKAPPLTTTPVSSYHHPLSHTL
jgi:hypothetical protein